MLAHLSNTRQAMDIQFDEITKQFGTLAIRGALPSSHVVPSLYQVLFLPNDTDAGASSVSQFTAFCPFSGILGRGATMNQAYKSWLAEAIRQFGMDTKLSLIQGDPLHFDELESRKLLVGEITIGSPISQKNMGGRSTIQTTPVFIVDCAEKEVIICPYKSEMAVADKDSPNPILSMDGKEMALPGFVVDYRVHCTKVLRVSSLYGLLNSFNTNTSNNTSTNNTNSNVPMAIH